MSTVARRILIKAINGHAYILRDMSGELMIALYYGQGECSSAFAPATGFYGPALPLR